MRNRVINEKIYSQKNFVKILSILSFALLILLLIIITITPEVNGYEISIYDGYPWYFWLFLIVSYFLAIILLVNEIFNKKNNNRWILGFFIFWLGNLILLLLPIFRGYCFYGGPSCDIYTHFGWIKEISNSGHFASEDFYPIIHILIKTISDLLGVHVTEVLKFIAPFFSVFFPIFMFLLAKTISRNKSQTILITSLSLPLIFSFYHLTIHPAYFSFVFLPILLFLYHKRISSEKKLEITILILTICFFIVFFHPITTLFSIIIIFTFILSTFLYKKRKLFPREDISNTKVSMDSNLLLILIVSFLTWYSSFGGGINSIKSIIQNLIYGSDYTIVGEYLSILGISNITITQTIGLFIIRYGAILIYILIALICLTLITKNYFFTKQINNLEFSYGIQLIVIFFVSILMIINNFIEGNPLRVFRFFVMITSIFSGLVIYQLLNKRKNKNNFSKYLKIKSSSKIILFLFIITLLFSTTILCLYNLYPSPITYEVNRQFTYMEFTGSAWITEKRNINLQTSGDVGFNLDRIEDYLNGVLNGSKRIKKESINTPTHFGYDNNDMLQQVFKFTSTYMITTKNGWQSVYAFPKNVQQLVHQWTEKDFIKLNNDQSVNKIYINKEFEVWLIHNI